MQINGGLHHRILHGLLIQKEYSQINHNNTMPLQNLEFKRNTENLQGRTDHTS